MNTCFKNDIQIHRINSKTTEWFILNQHYAQRMPPISYAFGIFYKNTLSGVCTFGKPASNSLCVGVCGEKFSNKVFELNRLVVKEGLPKNSLSLFVSTCLKMLKEDDLIIVSYADEGKGHHGYIYQATNWLYTGKTKERTDKYTPGGKHSRHYTEEYNHLRKIRTPKHRYIYFTGKNKKEYLNCLNYDIKQYPKGDNERYVMGEKLKDAVINKNTGEIFYE